MQNLTIVIPYRDESAALLRLLSSMPDIPTIVIDDNSTVKPSWIDAVVNRPHLRHIDLPDRRYFSGAVNVGIRACLTDVLVLNQDIWFNDASEHWLTEIDRLRREYAVFGHGVTRHPAWPMGYVQGTFMFMRRDAIDAVGPFNVKDFPLWGATSDWQARACRKGFKSLPIGDMAWFEHEERHQSRYGSSITKLVNEQPEQKDWFIRTPPLVSIIIPCYNYGHYLQDCINSIRGGPTSQGVQPGQSFTAWEAIIVDDCSTDDSYQVAQSLADPWQGIRAVRTIRNSGTAEAINTGIRAAYGTYFTICSADDMLAPGYLEALYRVVENNPRLVPYTDQLIMDGRGKRVAWQMREYDFDSLLVRNHIPPGIMASKQAWREVGGYPRVFGTGREDWAFAVALGRSGYCGVRVPGPLYWYRRQGQNRTDKNRTAEWRATFVRQMKETFPDLYRGEKPMGCCGGSRRRSQSQPKARLPGGAVKLAAPQDHMIKLEYIGQNQGNGSWWGDVTQTHYRFGPNRRIGYVYESDVDDLLSKRIGRRPVFRRYADPAPAEWEPPPAPEVDAVAVEMEMATPMPEHADAVATVTAIVAEEQAKKRKPRKHADA